MATEKKSTEKQGETKRIIGASKSQTGHWRVGFFWPARLVWADVTDEQLKQIKSDDRLVSAVGQFIVDEGQEDIPSALTLMAAQKRKLDENRALAEAAIRNRNAQK